MSIFVVTNGERFSGHNPALTDDGVRQISAIREAGILMPQLVIVGTGRRFRHTFDVLFPDGHENVQHSPFCGSECSANKDCTIALTETTNIPVSAYVGPVACASFDPWDFLSRLPADTLICAGSEFMFALGKKNEKGRLYKIDTSDKTCQMVV